MIPDTPGRLICCGDVHGCDHILKIVLDGIKPQLDDTMVFLGDLCNRGPNTKGVLDLVMSLPCHVYTVMGNHEEMILAAYQGGASDHRYWCMYGGEQTLESFNALRAKDIPGEYLNFIANCANYHESADFIFVHAGCDPNQEMDKQRGQVLRWDLLNKNQTKHISGKTVVCGHSVQQKKIFDIGHLLCIDTGCGIWPGGRLTAIDLKSGTIWQAIGRSKKATVKKR